MVKIIELIKQPKPVYHTAQALPNLTLVIGMDIKKLEKGVIGKAPGILR